MAEDNRKLKNALYEIDGLLSDWQQGCFLVVRDDMGLGDDDRLFKLDHLIGMVRNLARSALGRSEIVMDTELQTYPLTVLPDYSSRYVVCEDE